MGVADIISDYSLEIFSLFSLVSLKLFSLNNVIMWECVGNYARKLSKNLSILTKLKLMCICLSCLNNLFMNNAAAAYG